MSDRSSTTLFERGLEVRRAVIGAYEVDRSLARSDAFMMAFQRMATEWCWGAVWARDGLDRRTRSMLNLAILTALGRPTELKSHVRGAVRNGVSKEEIMEILLHATVYCGIPAGAEAFRSAHEAIEELKEASDTTK
ncbi:MULTISPECIES: carboxymuconolactone decarboxylase family protein [unclassified Bradyrhizobium]|uniref:carboxymuconolactone decarboxylase family protein n=1 Tax=unclassified Bradyrhizobium TaxID=2631580 RepID=UPI0024790262|nr:MULTISPECIES: carboxymuconolactone decarboxylase family protein [unclassified Bradyrhizobium]WGR73104.1 carboxymuconolactone decarboxylase family protein [Bradyrhizobium sp. ISRA426]WGR77944.1 carboxymuconolactone decarboxylase family protein [Bradyrhizobium sp. ISRA430]WGR88345.1 carboxymuconolactone decarboxylase family protein [Bradyrhizobium sp. ISRA432]